jgi:hypothetical protein
LILGMCLVHLYRGISQINSTVPDARGRRRKCPLMKVDLPPSGNCGEVTTASTADALFMDLPLPGTVCSVRRAMHVKFAGQIRVA